MNAAHARRRAGSDRIAPVSFVRERHLLVRERMSLRRKRPNVPWLPWLPLVECSLSACRTPSASVCLCVFSLFFFLPHRAPPFPLPFPPDGSPSLPSARALARASSAPPACVSPPRALPPLVFPLLRSLFSVACLASFSERKHGDLGGVLLPPPPPPPRSCRRPRGRPRRGGSRARTARRADPTSV